MDVDRQSWVSTLVKNHDENKTYILVKFSESFSNAIQEYSAQNQSNNNFNNINNNNNHHHTTNHHNHHHYNNNSSNNHHRNHTNHQHHDNHLLPNSHRHQQQQNKRPKLHHNHQNFSIDNNISSATNNTSTTTTTDQTNQQQQQQPTIKFHGTRGAIRFPNGKSYDFSLEQSDNSVECIKQTKKKWESVGKVACCLHVKGKDDVYQRTRTKMEAAEQEKRKYCTKLLGDSPEQNLTTSSSATTTSHHYKTSLPLSSSSSASSSSSSSSLTAAAAAKTVATPTTAANTSTTTAKAIKLSSSSSSSSTHKLHNHHANNYGNSSAKNNITNNNNNSRNNNSTNNSSNNNNNNNNNNNSISSNSTNNNYANLYPDINDGEQLKKYKADFDKDFKEYQNLHGYLHRIEERFRKLRELLKQSVEGSPEWESAKEQIFNEYERVKSDSNFHRARSKYKQLYNKLAHLKEKIFQFKRQQRDKNNKKRK